jgi:hypothetical protein
VEDIGFDTGFSPAPDMLRAPDLAVGKIPDTPGWVHAVPPLAVEYADTGQDEGQLALKIQDLLEAGTRYVWVVRLTGPRRVEVHESGKPTRIAGPEELLDAPGILANALPVAALYDPEVSAEVALRNLLQRHGYASLEAVRAEGEAKGEAAALRASIRDVFAARGLDVGGAALEAIAGCEDPALLRRWHRQAVTAASADDLLAPTS